MFVSMLRATFYTFLGIVPKVDPGMALFYAISKLTKFPKKTIFQFLLRLSLEILNFRQADKNKSLSPTRFFPRHLKIFTHSLGLQEIVNIYLFHFFQMWPNSLLSPAQITFDLSKRLFTHFLAFAWESVKRTTKYVDFIWTRNSNLYFRCWILAS